MHCKVKLLRHRGVRKADRDISADPGTDGNLCLFYVGTSPWLSLTMWGHGKSDDLLPVLRDARLVTMTEDGMLFHGIEGEEGKPSYAQSWSARLIR